MTSNHTDYNYTYQHQQHREEPPTSSCEWFAWTLTGVTTQMTLGTISTCSSALILYIIFRSPIKLKSTFHRIMALLSAFDICLSSGFASGTFPIPESSIPYSTPTLGTTGTCTAQGLMMTIGGAGVMDMTLCLAWYYVCRILRVSNRAIMRIYEPIFYTYLIIKNAVMVPTIFNNDWINVQHWSAYCGTSPIPTSCWLQDSDTEGSMSMGADHVTVTDPNKCQWPTDPNDSFLQILHYGEILGAIQFLSIVVAMLIVNVVVYQNLREITADHDHDVDDDDDDDEEANNVEDIHVLKEEILNIQRQAFLFVLACLVTWSFYFPTPVDETCTDTTATLRIHDILQTILPPLGGFWNMIIFIHINICLIRDSNNHDITSNFKAFKVIIMQPDSIADIVLSGIDNVRTETTGYTSHPSAYDDLLSQSRAQTGDASGMSMLVSTYGSIGGDVQTRDTTCTVDSIDLDSIVALPNLISSHQRISKKKEYRRKKRDRSSDLSNETTRKFYPDTPKEYLNFSGDTLSAALNWDANSGIQGSSGDHTYPLQCSDSLLSDHSEVYDHTKLPLLSPPPCPSEATRRVEGDESHTRSFASSSSFTSSTNFLSAFSSNTRTLATTTDDPSTLNFMSEEREKERYYLDDEKRRS